jgi:hypothetical protein
VDLLQFNKPTDEQEYADLVKERGQLSNVIFSPIRGGSRDMSPSQKLINLYSDFPNSVVLCSMFNLEHLKQNIQIADARPGNQ